MKTHRIAYELTAALIFAIVYHRTGKDEHLALSSDHLERVADDLDEEDDARALEAADALTDAIDEAPPQSIVRGIDEQPQTFGND